MKKSLRIKLCVTGVFLVIVFVLLNILFTYLWMTPFSMRFTANQLERLADTMGEQMDLSEDDFQNYIEEIDENYGTTVTVINRNKKIVATTSSVREQKQKLGPVSDSLFDENIEQLDKGKAVHFFREKNKATDTDKSDRNKTYRKSAVISQGVNQEINSESVRIIVIKKIADDRYVFLRRTIKSFYYATFSAIIFDLLAGGIIIIISIVTVWWLSNYVVRPIKKITTVAENIANLEFGIEAPENGKDELGQLGASINRMSEHLESNMIQLQADIDNRKRLVRNLSHEIKSPVAVIMGYADRMKAVISKNPEKAVSYCEIISNESNRIDVLVREMLDLSKMEQRMDELNLETILVKHIIEKIETRVKEENIERNIEIITSCEDAAVVADGGLIERAVYNLVNNAVRHAVEDNLTITITGRSEADYYSVKVHNTGSHIEEEELPYIWDTFYKVDKARVRNKNGCGIGLSIVKEIMDAHRGSYEAGNDEAGVYLILKIPKNIK